MYPFSPRHRKLRVLRNADGSIYAIREPGDPVFDVLWLEDEAVRRFFAASDRTWRLSHGGTVEDEVDREKAEARLRLRLMMRRAR